MKYFTLPLLLLLLQTFLFAQTRPADLVVTNAKVRTMTSHNEVVEAFAISGNRITAIGSNKLIKTFIGASTRVIDAQGRLVLPGFNDAHVHFMAIGNSFSSIDLRNVRGGGDMTKQIARFAQFLPKGRWILGGHFKNDNWEMPDPKSIDTVTPHNPVFLYQSGAETAFANTLAYKLAGLNDGAGDGETTVRGGALRKLAATVPADHTTNWLEIAETATNYAASLGVTSVHDMHSDDRRDIYLELQRQGNLKTRIYDCLPLRDWNKLTLSRLPSRTGSMVTDGCLKSFSDGDDESKTVLEREVIAADKAGLQIMIHAIGGSANRIVLDVFETAIKANRVRDRRFRIEHAHNAADVDLPRFNRWNIIASMQPFLFRGGEGSRYGTLLKQKSNVAFGSDASMVDLDPLLGIHVAVDNGTDSLSVYEAVRAYTVSSAHAQFREKEKGTIEPNKLADFVILSDDIFTIDRQKIPGVKIVMTVVDGKVVYQSN